MSSHFQDPEFQNQMLAYGRNLLMALPEIRASLSCCNERGEGSPLDPAHALRVCRESFRWGEPYLLWQDEERLLLGIALSLNQNFIGGVLAHDVLVPEAHTPSVFSQLQQMGLEWMAWLVRHNAVNEALMRLHRQQGREERFKAEAIHELKQDHNLELRKRFGQAEPELLLAVRRGDRPEARKLLNLLIMQAYNLVSQDFLQVRALLAELVALLRATAREIAGEQIGAGRLQTPFWETLGGIQDEEDLSRWLRNMLETTMDQIESSSVPPGKLRADLVLNYMRMNFHRPLSRKEVSGKAGLSEAEFSRMIHRETGQTFSHQLTAMRIDHACRLLRKSSLSIQEIAFACGFEDAAYFSTVFRKWTGKSPGSFRGK